MNPIHEEGLRNEDIAAYKKTNASPALKKKETKPTLLSIALIFLLIIEPLLTVSATYPTIIIPPEPGLR